MTKTKATEKKRITNNEKCANAILEWVIKNNLANGAMSIYFNDKAYRFIDDNTYNTIENIKGSTFITYANDDKTVSMSFEGNFYHVVNRTWEYGNIGDKYENEFTELIDSFGFYYELGHPWNLSLYEK